MIRTYPIELSFSTSYEQARSLFMLAAERAQAPVFSYVHPCVGRFGETLAVDCAVQGDAGAQKLLIVSSGCHGVEGYCGSGIQVESLRDTGLAQTAVKLGICILYIHALNPHGFSYGRRVTEDNVDLNRNFQNFNLPLPTNLGYRQWHHLLLPAQWPPGMGNKAALLAARILRSTTDIQQAVTTGQYEFPDGMFYGGQHPTWSNTTLRQIIRDHATNAQHIAWIDLHTGLGPMGHGERIFAAGNSPPTDYARANQWWGSYEMPVTRADKGESASAVLVGTINTAVCQECPQASLTKIALEFGTLAALDVLQALRADHWKHNNPGAPQQLVRAIERQILDAFYVDTLPWKVRVVSQALDAITQGIQGLSQMACRAAS